MKEVKELKKGEVIKEGGEYFRVIDITRHSTVGQMAGAFFVKLQNLRSGHISERRYKTDDAVEDVYLERREAEYLYNDGDNYYFMDLTTYEQYPIPATIVGERGRFLVPNMKLPIEILDGLPVDVVFPDTVVLKVVSTAAPMKGETDNVWKKAILENDVETLVPPFIKNGDEVRVRVPTGEYVERVKG